MPARRPQRRPPQTGKIERQYARQLRQIARHVGDIVGAFTPGDPSAEPVIRRALENYAAVIDGWASVTAQHMLDAIRREDETAWRDRSREMGAWLRDEIRSAPVGELMRERLAEQVTLIKSIPLDAAQRVHEWTLTGIEDATRAKEVAREILRTNEVSAARATLIARTETARTSSKLTEARAQYVGSEGYIWRTSGDSDVRDSHKEMNGKYVRWDTPPTLSDGTVTHAGQIYNCRCYPEPVIPDPT
jgi:SPP1 gp7 family putative phage head morphogenesis protein